MDDTDRLDFLLKFIKVDDIGDDLPCPGIVVNHESMEDSLSWGVANSNHQRPSLVQTWDANPRTVIDKAIEAHGRG